MLDPCLFPFWISFKLFGEKYSTYFWAQSTSALNTERIGTTHGDKCHKRLDLTKNVNEMATAYLVWYDNSVWYSIT